MLAETEADATTRDASTNVAIGNAVLAGIAAADAITCAVGGRRSASPDHRSAANLLDDLLGRDGRQITNAFRRLVDLKTDAQYGAKPLPRSKVTTALRQATLLVDHARTVVRR